MAGGHPPWRSQGGMVVLGYFHDLTLIENLKAVGEIIIKNDRERQEKISTLISKFALDNVQEIKAKYLSGGQRKRLTICMALLGDPKILFCDEIFQALDVQTIHMLKEILVNLQNENPKICIVVIEHNARELLQVVDRALILSNCKIVAEGSLIISSKMKMQDHTILVNFSKISDQGMKNIIKINKVINPFNKTIYVEGDKSLSIRWVLLSSLSKKTSVAYNLLISDDVKNAIECIKKLGAKVKINKKKCEITGVGFNYKIKKNLVLNAGNSGTLGRLILGLLINYENDFKLIGDKSLSKRDFSRVSTPLKKIWCFIFFFKNTSFDNERNKKSKINKIF